MASRREVHSDMSRPAFLQALQGLFPELETLKHGDTLARLLERIEPQKLEESFVRLLRRYIRNKKFKHYLINNCYPIAIDGTQKLVRDGELWGEQWLERHVETNHYEKTQQFVYVLEANLVFSNGLTIPLYCSFLSYNEDDSEQVKQDCELKAFKRLSHKLKKYFPRLQIILLLDGLYANGPVMDLCKEYNWEYMIVLQNKCLPEVWKKFEELKPKQNHNELSNIYKREQHFYWVNGIHYSYDNKGVLISVVVCDSIWQEVDPNTEEILDKKSRHVWISSRFLEKNHVLELCNDGARYRWGIENSINTDSLRGYCYEHPFLYNFNAWLSYHYLMRMAHALNALALNNKQGAKFVRQMGIRPFLKFVRETLSGLWLDIQWMADLLTKPFQLRLESLQTAN